MVIRFVSSIICLSYCKLFTGEVEPLDDAFTETDWKNIMAGQFDKLKKPSQKYTGGAGADAGVDASQRIRRKTIDFSRFKFAESITVGEILHRPHSEAQEFCDNCIKVLCKIKKLEIIDCCRKHNGSQSFIKNMQYLLNRNINQLESIRIEIVSKFEPYDDNSNVYMGYSHASSRSSVWDHVCKSTNNSGTSTLHNVNLKLKHLELSCGDEDCSRKLDCFPQLIGLKTLIITGCAIFSYDFWQSLIANEKTLCEMETFAIRVPNIEPQNKDLCKKIKLLRIWVAVFSLRQGFFVNHFLHHMVLSMRKLDYFNSGGEYGNDNMKFKCCIMYIVITWE